MPKRGSNQDTAITDHTQGCSEGGALKGLRIAYNVQGHVLECLTFYVGVHRNP